MNVNSWLKRAKAKIDSLDAELILLDVLGFLDRSELVLYAERELSPEEKRLAEQGLKRRGTGEPLAYILGRKEFYGREFLVTPETLIPRPETETCIEMILERIRSGGIMGRGQTEGGSWQARDFNGLILDVGTGSGCIGITLALEMPGCEVVGLDISDKALEVARKNAERLGAKAVKFLRSDLLAGYQGVRPEIIVANLPYVDREWEWVSPGLRFEPEVALYAEGHGLRLIDRLLDEIKQKWYNKKDDNFTYLYLEADSCQHQEIIRYAKESGFDFCGTRGLIIELRI